ncbi:putative glucose-6-phosphate 1-epimerase isoform X3 [Brassica rapa]|nr:putative glucose-6-phosphate 1-epimerase isoform X3 [Brassica rapa]
MLGHVANSTESICCAGSLKRELPSSLCYKMLVGVVAMAREHRLFERTKGINGLEKIIISDRHCQSFGVYLYGGQVTAWKNEKGEELLFASGQTYDSDYRPASDVNGYSSYNL